MDSSDYLSGLLAVIAAPDAGTKAALLARLAPPDDGADWAAPALPLRPGRPARWREQPPGPPPRKRRTLADARMRRRFLLALHHIEVSAIDLACACALRGGGMPAAFHADQLRVAAEEAVHAALIADEVARRGAAPGDLPVHFRLWDACLACTDLGEQLVVVPRVLEAHGLDVSAQVLPRLAGIDPAAHAVVTRIYDDEVGHVATGTQWHRHWCQARGLDPATHFAEVLARRFADAALPPTPPDEVGRRRAGFNDAELAALARYRAG